MRGRSKSLFGKISSHSYAIAADSSITKQALRPMIEIKPSKYGLEFSFVFKAWQWEHIEICAHCHNEEDG
nr:hypothetical protein [uncultured Desulfobacter sp.]